MTDDEADLRAPLGTLDPEARHHLRRVLIRDQADRDAISSLLMGTATGTARTEPTSSTTRRCGRMLAVAWCSSR
jgi:hypothetical protein